MSAALCMPTADPSQNCCLGSGEGAACSQDWDCLGLMTCDQGRCGGGPSGCQDFCERLHEGRMINCCVAESINLHRCRDDTDCLGARICDLTNGGVCSGISGCGDINDKTALKVIYDIECLCLGISNTCLFPDGVPCQERCRYVRQGGAASCTLNLNNNLG